MIRCLCFHESETGRDSWESLKGNGEGSQADVLRMHDLQWLDHLDCACDIQEAVFKNQPTIVHYLWAVH